MRAREKPERCWDRPGIPHKGWTCRYVIDTGPIVDKSEPTDCEMCGKEELRYIYVMDHPDWETLGAGSECASKMIDIYVDDLREMEAMLRNRAARRKRWLSRDWQLSRKGNYYLNIDGLNIGYFPAGGSWKWWAGETTSPKSYPTEEEAALALFDALYPDRVRPEDIRGRRRPGPGCRKDPGPSFTFTIPLKPGVAKS